jgi:hypothetical protein
MPPGVHAFCLPSMSKFSMLAGMTLTMNLLLFGANIQVTPFRPVFNPGRPGARHSPDVMRSVSRWPTPAACAVPRRGIRAPLFTRLAPCDDGNTTSLDQAVWRVPLWQD